MEKWLVIMLFNPQESIYFRLLEESLAVHIYTYIANGILPSSFTIYTETKSITTVSHWILTEQTRALSAYAAKNLM